MKHNQALPQPTGMPHAGPANNGTRPPWGWITLGLATLLASCATPVPPAAPTVALPAPIPETAPATVVTPEPKLVSMALTAKDYRQDGARHLYNHNSHRIFRGQMPPLMHAVGVLQIDIDKLGQVRRMNWMRAPSHAPDVIKEIERTVHAAAPFPAPMRLGGVTYTDVWLWDKSGNFQLDTLTEGQRLR